MRLPFQSYLKDGAGWSAKSIDANLETVNSWEKFTKCREFHRIHPGLIADFNGIFATCFLIGCPIGRDSNRSTAMVLLLVAAILATLVWTSARWVVPPNVAFEQITGTTVVERKRLADALRLPQCESVSDNALPS